ncbi:MAG TPA: phosphatidylglycerophosphatase A [Anaerohalosphaeraceae bacterium]|nr:phosphatidylglycerophosphatase A [Anaerohalosphaeraceae bacterium]HOL32372.1 phosphatidylglycerophosphatase A [Anaerohalosphaeraceae bacterium]HOM76780.1 phosphatidylglycerophosphatase A [Anaerohalosphaeraceae bacterium]HPC65124.1 phosphatidylglycerophosphatase A [Anaerohalosphaeraceae bacterium]HPO70436.1 phosphatidylglycerophosphatase A [Anaerohalosphaeraceae bacterium]
MTKEELLTTVFGLGKLPAAPGTFGSLASVLLYLLLGYVYPSANWYVMALLAALGTWVCIEYGPQMTAITGKKDPPEVVADEAAGQALVMLAITLLNPAKICNAGVTGFVLFRLFDIFKPFPCKQLEKLKGGYGILADDLMAAVYAAAVFIVLRRFLPAFFG